MYRRKYSSGNYRYINGVLATEYKMSSIVADTAYEFRIVAVNDAGQSQPSNAIVVTTSSKGKLTKTRKGGNGDALHAFGF